MGDVRKSLAMSFGTEAGGTRNLSVPNPVPGITSSEAVTAGLRFVAANPFDERITGLGRATLVTQTTVALV